MSSLKRHSAIYLAGRVGPALVNLLATAVYTRLAVPSEYAYLVLANSIAQVGSAALFQWLRMSLLRLAPEATPQELLGTMGRLYSIQAVVVAVLGSLAYPFVADLPGGRLFWFLSMCMLLAQAWFDFCQELQRSSLKPLNYSLTFGLRSILGLALGSTALALTGSGMLLVVCIAASLFVSPLFFGADALRTRHSYSRDLAWRIVRYGWPLSVAMLLSSMTTMGDRLIIGILMDTSAVGAYGPASDIAKQAIFVVAQSVALAGYPLALRALKNGGPEEARRNMAGTFELLFFFACTASAAVMFFAEEISYIMYGEEYRSAGMVVLPIAALGAFAMSMRMFYFDQALQLAERSKVQLAVSALMAVVTITLCFALIPSWGIEGAALAVAAGQVAGLVASFTASRLIFPLPVSWSVIFRTLLSCAGMLAAGQVVRQSLDDLSAWRCVAVGTAALVGLLGVGLVVKSPVAAVFSGWRNR